MANTPIWGIWYPTTLNQVTPLASAFASLATSVETALSGASTGKSEWYYKPAASRAGLTGHVAGDYYQESDSNKYLWFYNGSSWINVSKGAGTASRATSVSVASGSSYTKAAISDGTTTGCVTFNDADDSFTVLVTGLYLVSAKSMWASNSTGNRVAAVYVGGTASDVIAVEAAASGSSTVVNATGILDLTAGDVLTLRRWQTSGGSLNETKASLSVARQGV